MKGNQAGTYLPSFSVEVCSFSKVALFSTLTRFSALDKVSELFKISVYWIGTIQELKNETMRQYLWKYVLEITVILHPVCVYSVLLFKIAHDIETLSKLRMGESIALKSQQLK